MDVLLSKFLLQIFKHNTIVKLKFQSMYSINVMIFIFTYQIKDMKTGGEREKVKVGCYFSLRTMIISSSVVVVLGFPLL